MRMWMVPPGKMCRKHLLGEHVELHMFLGSLRREKNVNGFLESRLLEPRSLAERHGELAGEMERRGYRHQSPLDGELAAKALRYLSEEARLVTVDRAASAKELARRCPDCAALLTGSD